MKKMILVGFCLLVTLKVGAAMASIKNEMKIIASDLKTISLSINNPSSNSSNIVLAEKIMASFQSIRDLNPLGGNLIEYQDLIDQEIVLFSELKKNLTAGDQKAALATLDQINVVKKEGHNKFK